MRSGDLEAMESYVEELANQKVAPIQSTMALREAYESAEQQEPLVRQHAEAVGAAFRQNPELVGLLATENYRYAPLVFRALARDIELTRAQEMLAAAETSKAEAVQKALSAYKAKVMGLPSTTTQAGTTLSAPTTARPAPATFEEARARTIEQLRGMGLV